jgi:hypothetical protein
MVSAIETARYEPLIKANCVPTIKNFELKITYPACRFERPTPVSFSDNDQSVGKAFFKKAAMAVCAFLL